jgi:hypothetical protein
MKRLKEKLLLLFAIMPIAAFASGSEIIPLLGIELFTIIGFITTLFLVKLNWIGKVLMIVVFVLTEFLIVKLIEGLSYLNDSLKINSICFFIPILTTLLSYLAFKGRFKKNKN